MKRGVLVALGVCLALLGLAFMALGGSLLSTFGSAGQARIPIGRVISEDGDAVVITAVEVATSIGEVSNDLWDVTIEVRGRDGLFAGVADQSDALSYLQGVPYELVTGIDSSVGRRTSTPIPGDAQPPPPTVQDFWLDQGVGPRFKVDWPAGSDDPALVVLNEDLAKGVSVDLALVVTLGWAPAVAYGSLLAGAVLLVGGIVLLVLAARRPRVSQSGQG